MKIFRWLLYLLVSVLLISLLVFFFFAGQQVDKQKNRCFLKKLPKISEKAKKLHSELVIADWHADNLLWDRNPLKRLNHGHIDIPRLIEGNVTLQVFDAVIKSPKGQNYNSTDSNSDNITLLAMVNRWPFRTWNSLCERAIYQSEKLHKAAKQSNGSLQIIRTKSDLQNLLDTRKKNPKTVGGLLSIEGLHALEGKLENIDRLYDEGYRLMGLTHFFDNKIGGSSSGVNKGGLTQFGKKVVHKLNEKGILIDLAHASPALISDVVNFSTQPIVVSHTGVKATKNSNRNLSDKEISAIAEKGGIIGIGFWEGAVGGIEPKYIARAIRHVVDIAGIEHVSLGSDYDGSTYVYFDASQLVVLTEALLKEGFSEQEIHQIMGENQIAFLLKHLP